MRPPPASKNMRTPTALRNGGSGQQLLMAITSTSRGAPPSSPHSGQGGGATSDATKAPNACSIYHGRSGTQKHDARAGLTRLEVVAMLGAGRGGLESAGDGSTWKVVDCCCCCFAGGGVAPCHFMSVRPTKIARLPQRRTARRAPREPRKRSREACSMCPRGEMHCLQAASWLLPGAAPLLARP